MNLLKNSALLIAFVSVLSFVSCESEDNINAKKETLYGLTADDAELSSLKKALELTGLNTTLEGTELLTVFAPTNTAFSNFLAENGFASLELVPVNTLRQILLNHVIVGKLKESDLPVNNYMNSSATGYASATNPLSLYFRRVDDVVTINGTASVSGQYLLASNGIIHKIDAVLGLPSVVDQIAANPNLSSLADALDTNTEYDFVAELSSINNGPYTVIAPLNSAFTSLSSEIPGTLSQSTLAAVLKYHVVLTSNTLSNSLADGAVINTFGGDSFSIQSTTANLRIKDYNNRLANFTTKDIQCYNGVIHIVDRVILPNLN